MYLRTQHNSTQTGPPQAAAVVPRVEVIYGDEMESPCDLLPETAFRADRETRVDRPALRAMYGVSGDELVYCPVNSLPVSSAHEKIKMLKKQLVVVESVRIQ